MTTQQPGQRLDDPVQSQQRKSQLARTRWLIAITALLVIAGGTIFWLVDRQSSLYAILPIVIFTVLSVIIGLFQWLFPVSSNVPDQPTFVIHPSILSQPTPPAPIEKAAHRGIAGLPLLTDARTIQQREHVVREVYAKLIQDDITAIALTGIGGAGKSTLAALIYRYTEEHRQTSNNPFLAETVWLTIDPAVTFADLAGNLFGVLERPLPDLGHLAPQNQAVILFNALNGIDQRRLIILDQFENLLDWDTGHALIEAVWQYCRAEKWQEAYELMEQEWMFHDLRNWGGNAILLELCLLLQQQQTWVPETMQLANTYSSLAWAYSALGRRIWAREYNEQWLKLYQDRGDRRGESQAFMALGWSYLMTGQAKQALAYYEQALEICENLGDRRSLGRKPGAQQPGQNFH